jgi:3-methylfumaryl-CoA hydratase
MKQRWGPSALQPEIVEETISELPTRMLAATLGHACPQTGPGLPIATLAHWLHCMPIVAHDDLDENGHPRRGRTLPDLPFHKRMFGGSDITFHAPVQIGEKVQRTGRVTSVELKKGRSGEFYLVNLRQEYRAEGRLLIEEDQKMVYRATVEARGVSAKPAARQETGAQWERRYLPDERMLFRYSALLFSAHRIHFDREFTLAEGYPALVVHGQLAATCLAQLAEEKAGRKLASFSYRSSGPLFENRPMLACGQQKDDVAELWALDDAGGFSIKATARFRS